MSKHFLDIANEVIHINFFGLAISINKKWYDSYYIAIDKSGRVYVYSRQPILNTAADAWTCVQSIAPTHYANVYDLSELYINSVNNWCIEEWTKLCWKLNEFPVLRTA